MPWRPGGRRLTGGARQEQYTEPQQDKPNSTTRKSNSAFGSVGHKKISRITDPFGLGRAGLPQGWRKNPRHSQCRWLLTQFGTQNLELPNLCFISLFWSGGLFLSPYRYRRRTLRHPSFCPKNKSGFLFARFSGYLPGLSGSSPEEGVF